MTITDINSLRQHAIDTLDKLSKKQITVEEAGVTSKLCENIVSTVKVQLEYAKILAQEPDIDFLENCTIPNGRLFDEAKKTKKLTIIQETGEVTDEEITRNQPKG